MFYGEARPSGRYVSRFSPSARILLPTVQFTFRERTRFTAKVRHRAIIRSQIRERCFVSGLRSRNSVYDYARNHTVSFSTRKFESIENLEPFRKIHRGSRLRVERIARSWMEKFTRYASSFASRSNDSLFRCSGTLNVEKLFLRPCIDSRVSLPKCTSILWDSCERKST